MLPLLGIGQTNSKVEKPIGELLSNEISPNEMKRNASFNLDEIKVRWKKAALENCTGVPCIVAPSFTCGTSTVSDLDGNSYNTVLIGTQCWTKQNLKVTQYNDGTPIPLDASGGANGYTAVETWSTRTTGAYTIYENESSTGTNATNYGFLYNWFAATDTRNLCPSGWHVPSTGEWTLLIQFIDPGANATGYPQSITAGGKLKSTSALWNVETPPSPGTDDYSFSILPGGEREDDGTFSLKRIYTIFWTTTPFTPSLSYLHGFSSFSSNAGRFPDKNLFGASIRCLKN
jgi:uncharacterized protein (TIGR02145 family)